MKKQPQDETTKERILTAAAAVFANSGFDGARVEEIAKLAGVNKALIYYYYQSKEDLLSILFNELKDAILTLLVSRETRISDITSPEAAAQIMNRILDLLEERQNVIRVVIMECAKRTPINTQIFSMLDEIITRMFSTTEGWAIEVGTNRSKAMVTEFFTGIMPMLDYVAYHEIWMERYGIEETILRKQFIESFLGTHFAYTVQGFPHKHGHPEA